MPCGRYRRSQLTSQSEYEAHRTRMMKIILGDDWEDKSVSQLIMEHPELRRMTLAGLLHRAHHLEQEQQPAIPLKVEVIPPGHQSGVVREQPRPTEERLAIEAPQQRETFEEWLRKRSPADAPIN